MLSNANAVLTKKQNSSGEKTNYLSNEHTRQNEKSAIFLFHLCVHSFVYRADFWANYMHKLQSTLLVNRIQLPTVVYYSTEHTNNRKSIKNKLSWICFNIFETQTKKKQTEFSRLSD